MDKNTDNPYHLPEDIKLYDITLKVSRSFWLALTNKRIQEVADLLEKTLADVAPSDCIFSEVDIKINIGELDSK